jgi:hypothetical protein
MWTNICFIPDPASSASCTYSAWVKVDVEDINLNKGQMFKKQKAFEAYQKEQSPKKDGADGGS